MALGRRPADRSPSSEARTVALRPLSHNSWNISMYVVYSKFQFYVYLLFIKLSVHRLPLSKIKQHKLNGARFKKLSEKRAAAAASSTDCSAISDEQDIESNHATAVS